jgi:hypothetical protein
MFNKGDSSIFVLIIEALLALGLFSTSLQWLIHSANSTTHEWEMIAAVDFAHAKCVRKQALTANIHQAKQWLDTRDIPSINTPLISVESCDAPRTTLNLTPIQQGEPNVDLPNWNITYYEH